MRWPNVGHSENTSNFRFSPFHFTLVVYFALPGYSTLQLSSPFNVRNAFSNRSNIRKNGMSFKMRRCFLSTPITITPNGKITVMEQTNRYKMSYTESKNKKAFNRHGGRERTSPSNFFFSFIIHLNANVLNEMKCTVQTE